ncbi:thiol-activated cytolysin family protein [Polaribacter sp. L3A8]|uniref:thiol-activated cytolysin family protein n=1 Tax=Polaribacter sp. L3A8 TaxID=2686361 RepID=UPI00131D44F6|nr:thiol-activated cytolysin family protein [Polaribacter sp. L3A8]
MKNLLNFTLILFFTLGINAQIKKTDTVKKSVKKGRLIKLKTNPKLIKKDTEDKEIPKKYYSLNGSKSGVINAKNPKFSFLKNFKVKDNFSSISDTYGERSVTVISDDEKNSIETTVVDTSGKELEDGLECVNQTITVNANSSSFKEFVEEAVPTWIKPGVILNVTDFLNFNRRPVVAARKPITIFTDLNRNGSVTEIIENPGSISQIQTAVNNLNKGGNVMSNFAPEYTEVHNIDEFSFEVYGEYRNNIIGIETAASYANRNRKESHYYIVEVFQNMFSISVEGLDAEQVFVEEQPNMQDFLYVSKVNYGRRIIVVLETKFKLNTKETDLSVEIDRLFQDGGVEYNSNRLKVKNEVTIKALFYGGDPTTDYRLVGNLIESGGLNAGASLRSYFESLPSNSEQAAPISYELSNLNNERLGMRSVFTQNIRTCTPKLTNNLKLKVTLTGIQNIQTRDSQDRKLTDIYGLQQYIEYKKTRSTFNNMNLKSIPGKEQYPMFSNRIGVANEDGIIHTNQIINGNGDNTITVKQDRSLNPEQINNSLIFTITPNLFDESVNTRFRIHSWLKEYTKLKNGLNKNVNPKVLVDWAYIDVDLKKIIQNLMYPDSGMLFDKPYPDTRLQTGDSFLIEEGGTNVMMPLAKSKNGNALVGPIKLNLPGTETTAIAWYEFRLVD